MKFKREKQKLVIELNAKEEGYFKKLAESVQDGIYYPNCDLIDKLHDFFSTKKEAAEYEVKEWK